MFREFEELALEFDAILWDVNRTRTLALENFLVSAELRAQSSREIPQREFLPFVRPWRTRFSGEILAFYGPSPLGNVLNYSASRVRNDYWLACVFQMERSTVLLLSTALSEGIPGFHTNNCESISTFNRLLRLRPQHRSTFTWKH